MNKLKVILYFCLILSLFTQEIILENQNVNTNENKQSLIKLENENEKSLNLDLVINLDNHLKNQTKFEENDSQIIKNFQSVDTLNSEVPYYFVYTFIAITFILFITYLLVTYYKNNKKYELLSVNIDSEMEYELLI